MPFHDASVAAGARSLSGRFSFRDFLVDFLGSLVPGIVFLVAVFLATLPPSLFLLEVLGAQTPQLPSAQIPDSAVPYLLGFVLFLLFAYIAGQLFFRQDPKVPDEESYERIKSNLDGQGPVRTEPGKKPDVQFPYLFLHEYLSQRGLDYLAEHVPWRGNDASSHRKRTKHFMNILKARLAFSYPDRCATIARNEAHIRLMSSMWYVSRSLVLIGAGALIVALVCLAIASFDQNSLLPLKHLTAALYPTAVLVLALALKVGIERVLHYQRIRECVFVLETAHWANEYCEKEIFGGL